MENKEVVDEDLLEKVAKVLNVPGEAIKSFDEEKAIYNFQNNYEGSNAGAHVTATNYQCTLNPIEKIVELYEASVRSEREKVELMQKIMDISK